MTNSTKIAYVSNRRREHVYGMIYYLSSATEVHKEGEYLWKEFGPF